MNLRITSGSLKNRRFSVPHTDLRPTEEKIRSAYFNTLFSLINFEGRSFLDIFSGSGAMAFEALSRGFEKASVIENNQKAVEKIKANALELGIDKNIEVIKNDAFKPGVYSGMAKRFNAIYIDPPYSLSVMIVEILNAMTVSDIIDPVCVIGVESDREIVWPDKDWNIKTKKFGDTFLTIFYNWEKNDEK